MTCIVLDIDGTLVDTTSYRVDGAIRKKFTLPGHDDEFSYWISLRPGFKQFLTRCFETGIVGVWSLGRRSYVAKVVALFPEKPSFVRTREDTPCVCKDLNQLKDAKIIMIDDHPENIIKSANATVVPVSHWHWNQKDDHALYDLCEHLNDY